MAKLTTHQHGVLLSNPWFAALPYQLRETIISRGRLRSHMAGEQFCRCGEPPAGLAIIVEGAVRLSSASLTGEEVVLAIFPPGHWLGEVPSLDGRPLTYDAYAHEETVLLCISQIAFEELCLQQPALINCILLMVCSELRLMWSVFEALSTMTIDRLVAGRLLGLAQSFGVKTTEGTRIEIRLPLDIVAKMVGATRQRVWQVLKAFEKTNLIGKQDNRIILLDAFRLENLAAGCPQVGRLREPHLNRRTGRIFNLHP